MPAKISKEVRQRIYELHRESKPVKEILSILKSEGVKISDKSIYNIIKENEENKVKNQSFASIEVDDEVSFNESFGEEEECKSIPTLTRGKVIIENDLILPCSNIQDKENTNYITHISSIINQGVKEGTEHFISKLNKGTEKEDRLDEIINETKKKVNTIISKQIATDHSI